MEEVQREPGVESAPVAGEQKPQGQESTGVEAAGGRPADSVPAAGEQVDPKAFAARLAQEREKLRREVEVELRQQMEAEQREAAERAAINQRLEEAGIDPPILTALLGAHPALREVKALAEKLRQQTAMQEEVADFAARFPDVKQIPPEVLEAKRQNPAVPIRYLYADFMHDRQKQEAAKRAAEELKARSKETTGPLASQTPQGKLDVEKMSKQQFAELVAKAKRGELKEL